MSDNDSEYLPIKLLVNTKNEASIGLIYQPSQSCKGAPKSTMIYKINLLNIYEIPNPTRDGIREKIFADHPFLKRNQKMIDNMDDAILKIFEERDERIQKQINQDMQEDHENKEGSAAKIPSITNK